MPETLTLAEFKTRLAVESLRRALGIEMTDAQALQVIVDDQQVAELYVQWRTGAFNQAPAATPEPSTPSPQEPAGKLPFWRRPVVIVLGAAAVVILIVVGIVGFNALGEQMRKQQFAEILSGNSAVSDSLRNLEGSTLDAVFSGNCEKVRDGWSMFDQMAAAQRNWEGVEGSSEISRKQWLVNNAATFEAAEEVCG